MVNSARSASSFIPLSIVFVADCDGEAQGAVLQSRPAVPLLPKEAA